MRRVSLCLVFPFVLACGPSGIVGIDNIREPTEPETPRETVPLTIRVQGTVTAADDRSPIAGAEVKVTHCLFCSVPPTLARTTTDDSGRYSFLFDWEERECHEVSLFLGVRAEGFFFRGFFGDITCTEELQIIDVRLTRLPT